MLTPSLGRSHQWKSLPIVFVQFLICDLVFVKWMCSVIHEFHNHNYFLGILIGEEHLIYVTDHNYVGVVFDII